MDDQEILIEELRRQLRNCRAALYETECQRQQVESKLSSTEYRIDHELEPRIKAEQRAYDMHVTSQEYGLSEDELECKRTCEGGACGPECMIFGEFDECTENMSKRELIEAYKINDNIADVLDENGLRLRRKFIDKIFDLKEIWRLLWR